MPLLAGGAFQIRIPVLCCLDLLVLLFVARFTSIRANVLESRIAGEDGQRLGRGIARLRHSGSRANIPAHYSEYSHPSQVIFYSSHAHIGS